MPKPAYPDRYLVDRVGTPDPDYSEYFVLNIVDNWIHREMVARLGNRYRQRGMEQLAQECFDALDQTLNAHAAVMERRNEAYRKQHKGTKTSKEVIHP